MNWIDAMSKISRKLLSTCEACGKEFSYYRSRYQGKIRKFCSIRCKHWTSNESVGSQSQAERDVIKLFQQKKYSMARFFDLPRSSRRDLDISLDVRCGGGYRVVKK